MNDVVEFTEEAVKEYLDKAIVLWRKKRVNADNREQDMQASHYVDAFQSVRSSLFGEILPK